MSATTAYIDHPALHVRDLAPHIAFFGEILGMTVTQTDGPADDLRQVWLLGGLQLIRDQDFAGPEGRLNHLGIICADVQAAIDGAVAHGATPLAKGPHWLRFPDGLVLEFLPQRGDAVRIIRGLDPRAQTA